MSGTSRAPALAVRNLTLAHGRQVVFGGLSHVFAQGSMTAVVGPNGAGKSTLLRALAGLHRPASGSIERFGLGADRFALLPHGLAGSDLPLTSRDIAATGLWPRIGAFRGIGRSEAAALEAALERVGLAGMASRLVGELSAGQRQRLLFARLILQDAPVLLLDEPFTALDPGSCADLLGLVRVWHAEGRTVIAVLHDLDLVRADFPEVLALGNVQALRGAA